MPEGGDAQITIGKPEIPEYLRPTYANLVNGNFTPYDFRLVFSLLTTPVGGPPDGAGSVVEVHPVAVADIVIPASVMHGLISLLQEQFNAYLDQFGAPGLEPEGPGGGIR